MSCHLPHGNTVSQYHACDQTWTLTGWFMRILEQSTFVRCRLQSIHTHNALITHCNFLECELSSADVDQTSWDDNTFTRCTFNEFAFTRKGEFRRNRVTDCKFTNTSLYFGSHLQLDGTHFLRCQMQGIRMGTVSIRGLHLTQCDFTGLTLAEIQDSQKTRREQWALAVAGATYTGPELAVRGIFWVGHGVRHLRLIFARW